LNPRFVSGKTQRFGLVRIDQKVHHLNLRGLPLFVLVYVGARR
jgi:hypothetical protein